MKEIGKRKPTKPPSLSWGHINQGVAIAANQPSLPPLRHHHHNTIITIDDHYPLPHPLLTSSSSRLAK